MTALPDGGQETPAQITVAADPTESFEALLAICADGVQARAAGTTPEWRPALVVVRAEEGPEEVPGTYLALARPRDGEATRIVLVAKMLEDTTVPTTRVVPPV